MNLAKSVTHLQAGIVTCYILNATIAAPQNNTPSEAFSYNATENPEKIATEAKNNGTRSKNEPVKLTMKQGLIMNQVIATYALKAPRNFLCKEQVEDFKDGLRSLEPWALQMFDSSSKLQPGILMGNLVEYGAFEQCLRIYRETENGPIRGKHCSFRIIPGESIMRIVMGFRNVSHKRFEKIKSNVIQGTRLIWSVCIPDACPAADVLNHFNRTLMKLAQGLEIIVTLKEEDCMTLSTRPQWSSEEYSFLILASGVVFAVLVCTIIDLMSRNGAFLRALGRISATEAGGMVADPFYCQLRKIEISTFILPSFKID